MEEEVKELSDPEVVEDSQDLSIENTALKDLLKENKDTIAKLSDELKQVKVMNAKLLNSLNVEQPKPSVEEILNSNFNRYRKGN